VLAPQRTPNTQHTAVPFGLTPLLQLSIFFFPFFPVVHLAQNWSIQITKSTKSQEGMPDTKSEKETVAPVNGPPERATAKAKGSSNVDQKKKGAKTDAKSAENKKKKKTTKKTAKKRKESKPAAAPSRFSRRLRAKKEGAK
jgi:hypothetical protein